jgi:hypothetical protein
MSHQILLGLDPEARCQGPPRTQDRHPRSHRRRDRGRLRPCEAASTIPPCTANGSARPGFADEKSSGASWRSTRCCSAQRQGVVQQRSASSRSRHRRDAGPTEPCRRNAKHNRRSGPYETLRRQARRRRSELRGETRSCDRVPRSERSRKIDDDAPDHGPRRPELRLGDRERTALPRSGLAPP